MRNQIILISALLAVVAAPSQAATSKQENIGAGVGATVGAVAGGPVGLLLGAAVGAKLGDVFNSKERQLAAAAQTAKAADASIAELQSERTSLQRDIHGLNDDVERLQALARPDLLSLMQAGIEMDLLFRTDEHVLADSTGERLQQLAATPGSNARGKRTAGWLCR